VRINIIKNPKMEENCARRKLRKDGKISPPTASNRVITEKVNP